MTQFLSLEDASPNSKCVLVVGGAGFIGSHVNEMLYRRGYQTIVLDNLSKGYREAVQHGIFIEGDITDIFLLDDIFTKYPIDAVMHFAAYKNVGESVKEPLKYYWNNVAGTINLLTAMQCHQIKCFIFSSSAAVYGTPHDTYLTETHPCEPINPYGQSKRMVEQILEDLDRTGQLRYCSLRYFNAAGGDPEGVIKNLESENSNLIPIILSSLIANKPVTIFGNDYPTPDGTCIRDYIHIYDLGEAHIAAMEKLWNGAPSCIYNLGNEQGHSVLEVITAVEKVTGQSVKTKIGKRREGDPPILVADVHLVQLELDWRPRYSTLETMIEHAWNAFSQSSSLKR